jgi:hypothetical protein
MEVPRIIISDEDGDWQVSYKNIPYEGVDVVHLVYPVYHNEYEKSATISDLLRRGYKEGRDMTGETVYEKNYAIRRKTDGTGSRLKKIEALKSVFMRVKKLFTEV